MEGNLDGGDYGAPPRRAAGDFFKSLYIAVTDGGGYTVTTRTITYTYDPLNRLTEAEYDDGKLFQYAYDAVGNRTTMTVAHESRITQYQYDEANRLTQVGGVSYTWDDAGNLLNDGLFSYTWDAAGRLVMAQNVTHTVVYTYNGDGVRVAQNADGVETRWVQDVIAGLPQVLIENANSKSQVYVYGVGRLAQFQDNAFEWFLDDALGSVRQVVDEDGAVLLAQEYDPYGQRLDAAGGGSSGYGYAGEQWDGSTGLVFLRARWYDPRTGWFVSKDLFLGYAGFPQTSNRYVYCLNNPINCTDPSGYDGPGKAALQWIGFGLGVLTAPIWVPAAEAAAIVAVPVILVTMIILNATRTRVEPLVEPLAHPTPRVKDPARGPGWPGRDSPATPEVIPKSVSDMPLAPQPTVETFDPWLSPRPRATPQPNPRPAPTLTSCPTAVATQTPSVPQYLMHYTDREGYERIIHPGIPGPYTMKPSPREWTAPEGIYFTDDLPYPGEEGPYDRKEISASIGVPYEKTEFYIRINRNRLQGVWTVRTRYTIRPEWIYVTGIPVDVTAAVIDHGPVAQLNP